MAATFWRPRATKGNIAKFSSADAARYGAFCRELDANADLLRGSSCKRRPISGAASTCKPCVKY